MKDKNDKINKLMLKHWPENRLLETAFHLVWANRNNSTIGFRETIFPDCIVQFINRKHYGSSYEGFFKELAKSRAWKKKFREKRKAKLKMKKH